MRIISPTPGQRFKIIADPVWPNITLMTDAKGPHVWTWSMTWRTFSASGSARTDNNKWNAKTAIENTGGTLRVAATAGGATANVEVQVLGLNPAPAAVTTYLATLLNSGGFDRIIAREASGRHFNGDGVPIRSFDNGYGMCQLTSPVPSIAQVWNWKRNVDAGLALFAQKRTQAISYLSQSGRTYTNDQLLREAVCRWNGGTYHTWDAAAGRWVRKPNILCVARHRGRFRNRGWDMTKAANTGQSEEQLFARDSPFDPSQKGIGNHQWDFYGVCYADAMFE